MTKTKHSLLMSAIALLLCCSMLIGTTFAWFTDSVTSSGNKIQSGTLKLDLELLEKDGSWTSLKDEPTALFNYDKWEPGYTDVKVLKIENEGTLALKWVAQFVSEKALSKLADVIDVYVTTETLSAYPTERDVVEKWTKAGTVAQFVNTIEQTTNGVLYAEGSTEGDSVAYLGIALKMREEANNDYQGLDLGGEFDIRIFATQLTSEEDSFDNTYDENAAFSVWNGVVPAEMPATLVVDGATQTIHVKDAAAFAYLSTLSEKWVDLYTDGEGRTYTNYANGAGANYYYSGQWTISLEADIDLDNNAIEPIKLVIGEGTGASTFKGNGHTIRNINTTTGLFADKNRVTYTQLTLENVKATNGALTGSADYSITNVTVKNATISGTDYVGGLVGYSYGEVNSCKVFDSSVIATGKEAGGLIGYVVTSADVAHVSSNFVKNVSVYAGNRAAGLVAQSNLKVLVYNNTIDTVTVGAVDTATYKPGAVVSNALAPENVYDNTVINANVADDTTTIAVVTNPTELGEAIKNNATNTIILAPGEYTLPTLANEDGLTIEGVPGTVIGGESASTGFGGNFGKDTTIKNLTFTGSSNGVRYSYAKGGNTTFENCTFASDGTYGFHIDQSNGATFTFNNCTFSGFNAFASDLVKVTFNNCTFLHNGNYGHTNIWSVGEFNNCIFGDKTSIGIRGSGKIFVDGVEESYYHEYVGSVESLVAFADTVKSGDPYAGQKVILVDDIDLAGVEWNPDKGFGGTFDGQGHTISNLTVNGTSNVGFFKSLNSTAVVENVIFDKAAVSGEHYVGVIVGWEGNETYNATIRKCTVQNSTITCDTDAANDNGDKAGAFVGYAVTLTIEDCVSKNNTVKAYRDFGGILGYSNGANVIVKNNTVENINLVIDNEVNYKNYTTDVDHDANAVVGEAAKGTVENNTVK